MADNFAGGFVVAGERSGVGKTMITLALAMAFRSRGLTVQCFKVGPDFIDPGFHTLITGRPSRNLDGWMTGSEYCRGVFAQSAREADLAIVEGVMGLYDGFSGTDEHGSTAQIAKWLGLPVVLVVDGSSLARTAGALVLGLETFDPDVEVAGVVFNRVSGQRHFEYLRDAVRQACRAEVLGCIPRSPAWQMPERHLGLVMAHEHENLAAAVREMAKSLEQSVSLDSLQQYRCRSGLCAAAPFAAPAGAGVPRIGVARDEAFCFYYPDNIELLTHAGAEVRWFSPLHDPHFPEGLSGLYLGGGYPELYARGLQNNESMRKAVLEFCRSGRPVYAECGGFLYLLEAITDPDGRRFEMSAFFPAAAKMMPRLQRLGYVEVEAFNGCPFLRDGQTARGHEFHYSDISPMPERVQRCLRVRRKRDGRAVTESYREGQVLAGYPHLHFASNPAFAENFVGRCRESIPAGPL